jgi:hypothetical protein
MVARDKLQCGGNNPVGLYLPIKAAVLKGTVSLDFLIHFMALKTKSQCGKMSRIYTYSPNAA